MKFAWAFLPAMVLADAPVAISPSSDSWTVGFIGAVIVVISWFAEIAATLREENDLTI